MREGQKPNKSLGDDPQETAIHRVCAVLESIANRFPPDSVESLAIRDAALAYTVVQQHDRLKVAYEKLRTAFDGVLTDEMKNDLRRHGIDPDEMDDEQ